MLRSLVCCSVIFLSIALVSCGFQCFSPVSPRQQARRFHRASSSLAAAAQDKEGYKFGDITKGLRKKATSAINDVTGNEQYTFGDLSRWADSKVKERINNVTGEEEYTFGDLSRWADSQVKAKISNYTGKEDYEVGDVSKEIIRRVSSGEYATEDVIFLCKALLTFGGGLSPVARFLPAKLLLEMMQFGLAEEVGGRLTGALSKTLDERFKETITGDPNYRLGDKTKQAIQKLMATATEKESTSKSATKEVGGSSEMDAALLAELEDWDRRLGIASTKDKKSGDGGPKL